MHRPWGRSLYEAHNPVRGSVGTTTIRKAHQGLSKGLFNERQNPLELSRRSLGTGVGSPGAGERSLIPASVRLLCLTGEAQGFERS